MNARAKGLASCREVKKILQDRGYLVEGPGFGVIFIPGTGAKPIHKDYFGVLDLVSYKNGQYWGHQVTDLSNKSKKIKALEEVGIQGWVWCRTKKGRKIEYRVFLGDIEIPI